MNNFVKALRGRNREEGFTLIELMVVVLIIAILMAIAIPTFLSARNTANARAAQSNVRNALSTEAAQYASSNAYQSSKTTLQSAEPALTWNGFATSPWISSGNNVYVEVDSTTPGTSQNVVIGALGADNMCYVLWDNAGTVGYAKPYAPNSSTACAAPTSSTTWYDSFIDAQNGKNAISGSLSASMTSIS